MCMGGYGIVSVASNIIGLQIKSMMNMIVEGNVQLAAKKHHQMLPLFKALFWVTNPVPIKYSLNKSGFNAGMPRLPMVAADASFIKMFDPVLASYEIDIPI